jgi:type I restriction enzyme R subunit
MSAFTESVVEQAALAWLEAAGWQVRNGAEIAPGEPAAERDDYGQVVLARRLRDALARLNPALPAEALDDAFRKLTRPGLENGGADLIVRNRALHRLLVDGVTVEYRDADGNIRGAQAQVIDFDDPAGNNDWLAVNQFSVVEQQHSRRPDVVLFVNGLPLAVLELKNAADENATIWSAFQQLQTYKAEVPALFAPNALLVVVRRRRGARRYARRRARVVQAVAHHRGRGRWPARMCPVAGRDRGLCAPRRFLDLLRDFIVFEDDGGRS